MKFAGCGPRGVLRCCCSTRRQSALLQERDLVSVGGPVLAAVGAWYLGLRTLRVLWHSRYDVII